MVVQSISSLYTQPHTSVNMHAYTITMYKHIPIHALRTRRHSHLNLRFVAVRWKCIKVCLLLSKPPVQIVHHSHLWIGTIKSRLPTTVNTRKKKSCVEFALADQSDSPNFLGALEADRWVVQNPKLHNEIIPGNWQYPKLTKGKSYCYCQQSSR